MCSEMCEYEETIQSLFDTMRTQFSTKMDTEMKTLFQELEWKILCCMHIKNERSSFFDKSLRQLIPVEIDDLNKYLQ